MKVYKSKCRKLPGTDYSEIYPQAWKIYVVIKRRSKRKPYVRSKYFSNQKVFIDYFWQHLNQQNRGDRNRRLKYYQCALDLIRNSKVDPVSKEQSQDKNTILHRFAGVTKDNELFFVQIKQEKRSGNKFFMSVFPIEKLK